MRKNRPPVKYEMESYAEKDVRMDKYQCQVCAHVYDPKKGEPGLGIAPGTPFKDLPADWICPVCGSPKDMYERMAQAPA